MRKYNGGDEEMEIMKSNVFDYLEWRGDLDFCQNALNEVDALILSIFAYLDFSFIRAGEAVPFQKAVKAGCQMQESFRSGCPRMIMNCVAELAERAAVSLRFQDVEVFGYRNIFDKQQEIQFAAVTFLLPDGTAFLSFRGTDSTLVGWKENFNMSFLDRIPSQMEAERYTVEIARKTGRQLHLGGHSKGGNLAVWAGAHLTTEYQDQVLAVYNNDGPGFGEGFLESEQYKSIKSKIHFYVPESSIVGVLLEHDEYITIGSSNSSVLQHDPFSWLISGNHFVYGSSRSSSAKQFDREVNRWLKELTIEEREKWIDGIYGVLSMANKKTEGDTGMTESGLKDLYERFLRDKK